MIIYLGYVVLIYHDPVWLEPSLEEDFDQRVLDNVELGTTVFLHHLLDADHGAVGGMLGFLLSPAEDARRWHTSSMKMTGFRNSSNRFSVTRMVLIPLALISGQRLDNI